MASFLIFSCEKKEVKDHQPTVEVRYSEKGAQLYRNGEPYFITGAAGTTHLEKVAEYGGNSIRTWSLQDADEILDKAHELGLTVTLGLEIGRPYWGKDFKYWKFWEVNKKIEELRPIIEKYRDHPALLIWGVGNEVNLFGKSNRVVAFYIVNKVAKMIKEVDPNHPTMTAITVPYEHSDKFISFRHFLRNIDIIGYNAFDAINRIYASIYGKKGWGKAYMLSEWGVTGHWEVGKTEWDAPRPLTDSQKKDVIEKYWYNINKDSSLFVGSYVFYWGSKVEVTHTWFSLFSEDGAKTEAVNFLKYAWSGKEIDKHAPIVSDIFIETKNGLENDNVYLPNNSRFNAIADVTDPEGDSLRYRWEIRPEEYYYYEFNPFFYNMEYLIQEQNENHVDFVTPKEDGPYRLYVFAYDNHGNVSSYNLPFYVVTQ